MEPDPKSETTEIRRKRPFLLTMLCAFSFVFYGALGILLLIGLFYSGFLAELFRTYNPGDTLNKTSFVLFFLGLSLMHWGAFSGTILIWKLRKKGYLIFSASALLISIFHLFLPDVSILVTSIHISLILLFGFFYNFYRL